MFELPVGRVIVDRLDIFVGNVCMKTIGHIFEHGK